MNFRGLPSRWLLKNSNGFPDFLFTILTYSMILLALVSLFWICFGILAFLNAGTPRGDFSIQVMDSMKTGLISLAGVIFSLAASYTVRRFKKDDHYLEKKKVDQEVLATDDMAKLPVNIVGPLQTVQDEEDI